MTKKTHNDKAVYKIIKNSIQGIRNGLSIVQIEKNIKEEIEKNNLPISYVEAIDIYLSSAIEEDDLSDAKNIFYKIFLSECEKTENSVYENAIGFYGMFFEGLQDILGYDYTPNSGAVVNKRRKSEEPLTEWLYGRAKFDEHLLIVGETGTSKEYLASFLHKVSKRRNKFFYAINCAAIPDTLIESTLFGHKKGSYTHAIEDRTGILEDANGGTVFVDELGKMPLYIQAKLLRVIEEQAVTKIGKNEPVKVNIRFIATMQPRENEEGKIYPDLLYRLGYPDVINVPNLVERMRVDPETVIQSAVKKALVMLNEDKKKENIGLQKIKVGYDAIDKLCHSGYKYPGNYRELISILKSAIRLVLAKGKKTIHNSDLKLFDKVLRESSGDINVIAKNIHNIKLKNIVDHANTIKAEIIKAKINDLKSRGKDLKEILIAEGYPMNKYNGYIKKLKRAGCIESFKKN